MNLVNNIRCLVVAVAGLVTVMPSLAQDTSLWNYKGADRHEKLVKAAQKEGSLTMYTSTAQKDIAPLIKPFEEKYGIKVNTWRSGSENVLNRTVTENKAKRYDADLIQSAALEMESLYREKIIVPVYSPYQQDLIPGAMRPHGGWAGTFLAVWVQAYNTNLIKKADLPKTFQDLLDPKWKGKLGIEADIPEWYSTIVMDMGEEKGIKFFTDLVNKNGISVRKGHSLLNNLVVAGEVPLALTVYNYMPETSKQKGAPIDWFVLDPAVARVSGVGMMATATHPNAALLFYDYLLSPEGQKIFQSLNYVTTSAKVPSPMHALRTKLVDPAVALDQGAKWDKSFEDVIKKSSTK